MARIPNDPDETSRSGFTDDRIDTRFEREAQIDPELSEGGLSNGRIALYAVGIALVLGVLFYGLNNSSIHEASTAPPAPTTQTQSAVPNNQPGMTTGSATNRPTPPQGTEIDRSANPGENSDTPH